jgi:hypothetical protein
MKRSRDQRRSGSFLHPGNGLVEVGDQGPLSTRRRSGRIAEPAPQPLDVPSSRRRGGGNGQNAPVDDLVQLDQHAGPLLITQD